MTEGTIWSAGNRVLLLLCIGMVLVSCSLGGADPTPARQPTAAAVVTPPADETASVVQTPPATPEAAPAAESPAPLEATPLVVAPTAELVATVEPTVAPTETVSEPTVVAAPLPAGYRRFSSKVNPYSIGYPRGWRARGNAFRFGSIRGDLFLQPTAGNTVSVNVLAEPLRGQQISTAEYVSLNLEQISRANGPKPNRAGTVRAAGRDAVLITRLDRSRPRQVLEITQAIWIQGDRGWVVTLANPQGQRSRYLPVLRTILSTMQVR